MTIENIPLDCIQFDGRPSLHLQNSKAMGPAGRCLECMASFLHLYRPTAKVATGVSGLIKASELWNTWDSTPSAWQELGLVTACVTLGIFRPSIGVLVSGGVQIARDWKRHQDNEVQIPELLGQTLLQILYVASSFHSGGSLLAASLFLQAVKEAIASSEAVEAGNTAEAYRQMILASIRLLGIVIHFDGSFFHLNRQDVAVLLVGIMITIVQPTGDEETPKKRTCSSELKA